MPGKGPGDGPGPHRPSRGDPLGARRRPRLPLIGRVEREEISPLAALRALGSGTPARQAPAAPPEAQGQGKSLAEAMHELDALVGLDHVKELTREIAALVRVQSLRAAQGLRSQPIVLHMLFSGNPGTGKTTVARLLGEILRAMGVLPRGHLVEVERADLVGEYIGHTAQKTREQIRKALGGILFVDEAYSLARGGDRDFGKESIDVLVKSLEDHKGQLAVVLAGYRREMAYFLEQNPGLRSRFPVHLDFPDYSLKDLVAIAEGMLAQRQYRMDPRSRAALWRRLQVVAAQEPVESGNARTVRNLVERAIRRHALRVTSRSTPPDREGLMTISAQDWEP